MNQNESKNQLVNEEEKYPVVTAIKEHLPGYAIDHAGHGIFNVCKNFTAKNEREIGVWIGDEAVVINCRLNIQQTNKTSDPTFEVVEGEYITVEEYNKEIELNSEYPDHSSEILMWTYVEGTKTNPIANQLFNESDLNEMLRVSHKLLTL